MIDDDQPHNGGDANVDKIAQREVKAGLKVLHNQGDKFKVEKVDHRAFHQCVFAGLLRSKEHIRQMHRLFTQKTTGIRPRLSRPRFSTVWSIVEINSTRGRVRDVIQHLILRGEVPV